MALFHTIFDKSHFKIGIMKLPKRRKCLCNLNLPLPLRILRTLVKANTWCLQKNVWVKKYRPNKKHFCKILLKNWKCRHFSVNRHKTFKLSGKYWFHCRFSKLVLLTLLLLDHVKLIFCLVWPTHMRKN